MKQDKFRNNILPLCDKLFRLALRITGNKQDAEDVVQDALFKIWKKSDEWDSIANLEAYCFRSTRNIAIDKLALKENQTEAWRENNDYPETTPCIQERLEQEEQLKMLDDFIAQLPEKQRTIFQLREIEELSYKEIAEVLAISEEQVKVNLFRSRQKLKSFFEE
ncbi:DNA-directed RNA polymerase sigma-70 factor [Bacteroidia bacterium]|nr:DNA-directed RNA polymerase sigma-70 factor [Bacteroidia bacterium]